MLRFTMLLLLLLVGCAIFAPAAEQQIVLTERLNRTWIREPVSYPFTAAEGACITESVRLTGAQGPIPVQLTQIERWPDTQFVKSARVVFIVNELAPLTEHAYTVSYGPKPAPDAQPASDLRVARTETGVEAINTRTGVRLLSGERTYTPATAAGNVPGPIAGLRLADGSWYGGSRCYGATPIQSYTARITEEGPVLVQAEYRFTYTDGNVLAITTKLYAESQQVTFATAVAKPQVQDGWDLLLTPGLKPLALQFMPETQTLQSGTHDIKGWKEKAIADYQPGTVTNLAPWAEWWNEYTQTKFYLKFADDPRELYIVRHDAGAWVTPGGGGNKSVPLLKGEDGSLFLHVNNAAGTRQWSIGENPSWEMKLPRLYRPNSVMQDEVESLDSVKDMVLDWPASAEKHPRLFFTADEMTAAAKENPAALKQFQDVPKMRNYLGLYGYFDTMRYAAMVACLYDGNIDSDRITPAERTCSRAQMAYLAYRLANPANWSPERGFRSGNPNMTVTHTLNLGLAACTLRDHPLAKSWVAPSLQSMEGWLNRLDAQGHWPESGHYARVSVSKFILFAIAAKQAGFHDYFTDARMKRMLLYYEKTLTPPDPQHVLNSSPKNVPKYGRLSPPIGRGSHGSNWGLGGLGARAVAQSDPELSQVLQWSYQQENYSTMLGEGMPGVDALYPDRTLPARAPVEWRSEFLPSVGALLRSGVSTPEENYLLLVTKNPTNPDGEIWPSEVGGLAAWFAKGRPISRRFTSVPDMANDHGLLINRVMLATNWKPGDKVPGGYATRETAQEFAALPRADYVRAGYEFLRPWNNISTPPPAVTPAFPVVPKVGSIPPAGQPPVSWQRQALWVHDDTPGGVQYLVLRDTVGGGQPTQWQFWTTSEKLGTPEQARDRDAFLADKPGANKVEASVLTGDRFTALGTLDVDVEYYIVTPTDTPRHTLRYGMRAPGYQVREFPLFQDLLHLQLPGDGAYFVAIYPHFRTETAPVFTTLAGGTVIKIAGAFGTDYAFLAGEKTEVTAEQVSFSGTAASVQQRGDDLVLTLGAPGSVECHDFALTAAMPADLRVAGTQLHLHCPPDNAGGQFVIEAPGRLTLQTGQRGNAG